MKGNLIIQNRSAGFFSDFNMITSCLTLLHEKNYTDFKIMWNNIYYSKDKDDSNLFDKFFYQSKDFESYNNTYDICAIAGHFLAHTNPIETWVRINNTLKRCNYFDNNIYKQCKAQCYNDQNTLGVHIRGTDHYTHGKLLDLSVYIHHIDNKIKDKGYANIFIATDENTVVDNLKKRYGDMIKVNKDITRSNNSHAIHYSNFDDKEKLAIDVLREGISLSLCDEILITSSNVSGYVLSIAPHIRHTFIDNHIQYH